MFRLIVLLLASDVTLQGNSLSYADFGDYPIFAVNGNTFDRIVEVSSNTVAMTTLLYILILVLHGVQSS